MSTRGESAEKMAVLAVAVLLAWLVSRVAVLAAEQLGYSGEEAKLWAIESAERALLTIGVEVDGEALADLIEAEVYRQFNQERK